MPTGNGAESAGRGDGNTRRRAGCRSSRINVLGLESREFSFNSRTRQIAGHSISQDLSDVDAVNFRLHLNQRADEIVAESQGAALHERMMHRGTHGAGEGDPLDHVLVVAQIFLRVGEAEWQSKKRLQGVSKPLSWA